MRKRRGIAVKSKEAEAEATSEAVTNTADVNEDGSTEHAEREPIKSITDPQVSDKDITAPAKASATSSSAVCKRKGRQAKGVKQLVVNTADDANQATEATTPSDVSVDSIKAVVEDATSFKVSAESLRGEDKVAIDGQDSCKTLDVMGGLASKQPELGAENRKQTAPSTAAVSTSNTSVTAIKLTASATKPTVSVPKSPAADLDDDIDVDLLLNVDDDDIQILQEEPDLRSRQAKAEQNEKIKWANAKEKHEMEKAKENEAQELLKEKLIETVILLKCKVSRVS